MDGGLFMKFKNILKKILYGPKATSESYIKYLKARGYSIGSGCKIYAPTKTSIDEPSFMLEIGNDVRITEGVTILCHDASVYTLDIAQRGRQNTDYFSAPRAYKKTIIGNNVFIGRYAILTMGTHVGDNVIIAAGAVCHGMLESNSVYGGNPAKKICSLQDYNMRCAKQYIDSAKEYAKALEESLGRTPSVDEMYVGFMPLFGKNYDGYVAYPKYPIFSTVKDLLDYTAESK